MPTQSLRLDETDAWQGCSLAYGHFNTIHPGHIRYLRHARGLGEQLVVALIGDGKTSYAFKQEERAEALSLLGIADAVLLLEADELDEAIEVLQPRCWSWAMSTRTTLRFRPPWCNNANRWHCSISRG